MGGVVAEPLHSVFPRIPNFQESFLSGNAAFDKLGEPIFKGIVEVAAVKLRFSPTKLFAKGENCVVNGICKLHLFESFAEPSHVVICSYNVNVHDSKVGILG